MFGLGGVKVVTLFVQVYRSRSDEPTFPSQFRRVNSCSIQCKYKLTCKAIS